MVQPVLATPHSVNIALLRSLGLEDNTGICSIVIVIRANQYPLVKVERYMEAPDEVIRLRKEFEMYELVPKES